MSRVNTASLNRITLTVFAPALVLVGVLGFVLPANVSLNSGAPAYNIFHIIFGGIGIALVAVKRESLIRLFNVGFGAIDIYQALASYFHLFPEPLFRWTRGDDLLHVVIGVLLVVIGIWKKRE